MLQFLIFQKKINFLLGVSLSFLHMFIELNSEIGKKGTIRDDR